MIAYTRFATSLQVQMTVLQLPWVWVNHMVSPFPAAIISHYVFMFKICELFYFTLYVPTGRRKKKKSAKTNGIFLQKLNSRLTKRHDVSVLCRNEEFIRKTVNNGSHWNVPQTTKKITQLNNEKLDEGCPKRKTSKQHHNQIYSPYFINSTRLIA